MRVRIAIGAGTAALLLIVVMAQAWFAWDQISRDGFLYALPAQGEVFIFASAVISVAALLLTCGPTGRRATLVSACAVGLLVLGATTILSGNLWSAIVAVLTLTACWRVGEWALAAAGVDIEGAVRGLVATGLGFALLALGIYIEGVTFGLSWYLTTLPMLALGILGLVGITRLAFAESRSVRDGVGSAWGRLASVGRVESMAAAVAAMAIGAISMWTAAPEVMYDPNWGKVWLPMAWAEAGRIVTFEFDAQTFIGGSFLNVTTVGHLVGADAIGRYAQLALGVVLAAFAWRIARPAAGPAIAAALGFAFLVTPHVVWQMGTANDDLILCLLAGALAMAVIRLRPFGWRAGLVMGILFGGALNGKLHLLPFAVVAVVGWWLLAPLRAKVPAGLAAAGAAVLVAGPQLLVRWVEVGNPLFPALNNVFRSPWWPPVNESFNLPFAPAGGLAEILKLPVLSVLEPTRFMEAVPRGVFGVLPALLLAFVLTGWWRTAWANRVVWAASVVALAAWWVQLRYLRYLLPYSFVALMFMADPLGSSRAWLAARLRRVRAALGVGAVALLGVACAGTATATFFNIAERVPLEVATAQEGQLDYLRRNMTGTYTLEAINEFTPPGARIVVDPSLVYQRVLLEDGRYLLPAWEMTGLLSWLRESGQVAEGPTNAASWGRLGVGWAAVGVDALRVGAYAGPVADVIAENGRLVWTNDVTALYRIEGTPRSAGRER